MNKTIFKLDIKPSIIILASVGILLGFLSNIFYVNGAMDFIFYIFRLLLIIFVFSLFTILEKNNEEFKKASKRNLGYLALSSVLNIAFAIFKITHILPNLFLTLSGVICFWVIASFVLEILCVCIDNKSINKIICMNEKIGKAIANPIVKLVNNIITND